MQRGLGWKIGAAVIAAGALVLAPMAAYADGTSTTGYDVSYPQCGATNYGLPSDFAYSIVGVNGGNAANNNECFPGESGFAIDNHNGVSTEQPKVAYYLNTGNPSLAGAWWPTANTTQAGTGISNPKGTCAHTASAACAYVYGYSMAEQDVNPTPVRTHEGPSIGTSGVTFWLDVETGNTWQSDTSANAASIAGMVEYLESKGATVGLYSTAYQWGKIAGTTSSTSVLAGLQSWLAGASSSSDAATRCSSSSLTPTGRVSLVQYPGTAIDHDFSCHIFSAPTPTISGVIGVGHTLTATRGDWALSPVTYKYQWKRNGSSISKATGSTYKTTSSDSGKTISVTISASKTGWNPLAKTSAGVTLPKVFTTDPAPVISGTAEVGHTLTAKHGVWGPGTVSYAYQWYRGGVAIAGAMSYTHSLVTADAGHTITVKITGTETGYTTVSKTSASVKARS